MFKAIQETQSVGKIQVPQTHYYLTQGDTCVIYATPYKDGQKLPLETVVKCLFKLSNQDYELEFEKELEAQEDKFVLRLEHEETKTWEIATHIYEFEYTLSGGAVQTPNQWKFDILDQIIG